MRSRPTSLPPAPLAVLDTRLPGTGEALTLAGLGEPVRWDADEAVPLADTLRAALDWIAGAGPDALVAGVADYPHDPHAPGARTTILGFRDHLRLPRVDDAALAHCFDTAAATGDFRLAGAFRPDWPDGAYRAGVERIQALLRAGDVYQVNLAQRFAAPCEGNAFAAWRRLRQRQSPPWSAWLDLGDRQVLSLSPETFLEVDGNRVRTRPIKGTRRRDPDPARDESLREELANAPKDRAENLMIVDLLRNDLGQVCRPGSVRAPDLFRVESFASVHHLVSTVTGELAEGHDVADLFAACFPGGSITGAPKRRAREIIRELESAPRGTYCGSVFWLDARGHFGSNIAIRTLTVSDGRMACWGGAGIVSDSDPAAEDQECRDKVGPLMRALEEAFLR